MSGIIGGAGSKSGVIGTTELDYEEGTFTAQMSANSGSEEDCGGVYTKIGRQVQIAFNFESKSTAGGSGGVEISGMPFTASTVLATIPSGGMYNGCVSSKYFDYTSGTNVQPFIQSGTTVIKFSTAGDSGIIGSFSYTDGTDRYLRVSCSYFT